MDRQLVLIKDEEIEEDIFLPLRLIKADTSFAVSVPKPDKTPIASVLIERAGDVLVLRVWDEEAMTLGEEASHQITLVKSVSQKCLMTKVVKKSQ